MNAKEQRRVMILTAMVSRTVSIAEAADCLAVQERRRGSVGAWQSGVPTQFGRLLDELGITSIAARSPQVKGRVERLFGTLQDRLVSMLWLAGATNAVEATACLAGFRDDFNARFPVPAAEKGDCYRAMETETALDTLFCVKDQRTVGMDNIVRLGEHRRQLLPGPCRRVWARAVVEVQEWLDGSLVVYYHGECLVTTPAPLEAPVPVAPRPLSCVESARSRRSAERHRGRIIHKSEASSSGVTKSLDNRILWSGRFWQSVASGIEPWKIWIGRFLSGRW